MYTFSEGLADATREKALGLYRSLQRLGDGLSDRTQRDLLSESLEEIITCIHEIETADGEITRTKAALEEAHQRGQEKSRRYLDLFNSAPCAYLLTDAVGIIREANQAAGKLLGVQPAYLTGKPLILFVPEAERISFHGKLEEAAREGGLQGWKSALQPRWTEAFEGEIGIGVMYDGAGNVTELRWMIQKSLGHARVSEPLLQAMAELRESQSSMQEVGARRVESLEAENEDLKQQLTIRQRAIDRMVGRMTEMENQLARLAAQAREALRSQNCASRYMTKACAEPLCTVRAHAAALAGDLEPCLPQDESRRLMTVVKRLDALNGRMDAVTLLSMIDGQPLKCRPVDTAQIVAEVVSGMKAECTNRNMDIRVGELPSCQADPELLKLLFGHLVSNAFKFTRCRDRAVVEVGCRSGKHRVWFVRDNGIGFRKDQEYRLFLPFQSLHRSHGFEGDGVGLAICKQVATRHGGRLWAEGEHDRGATFCFTLHETRQE